MYSIPVIYFYPLNVANQQVSMSVRRKRGNMVHHSHPHHVTHTSITVYFFIFLAQSDGGTVHHIAYRFYDQQIIHHFLK